VGTAAPYYVNVTALNPVLECSPAAQDVRLGIYTPTNVTFRILKDVASNVTLTVSRPDLCTQANNISDSVGMENVAFTCTLPANHSLNTTDQVTLTMNSSPSYASTQSCSFNLVPVQSPIIFFRGRMSGRDVFAIPGSTRDIYMPLSAAGPGYVYSLNLAANCTQNISAALNETFIPELDPGVERMLNLSISVAPGSPDYKGACTVDATDITGHSTSVTFNVRVLNVTSSFAPTSGVGLTYAYYDAYFAGQGFDFVKSLNAYSDNCALGPLDKFAWQYSGSSASHICSFPAVANQTTYYPHFRFYAYTPFNAYAWNAGYAALALNDGHTGDSQITLVDETRPFVDIDNRGFTCHTVSFAWTTLSSCDSHIDWGLSPVMTAVVLNQSNTLYHYLTIGGYDPIVNRTVLPNDTIYYRIDDCDLSTADPTLTMKIQDEAHRQGYGALVCPSPLSLTLLVNATHIVNLAVFPTAPSVNVDTAAAMISSNNTANITCGPLSQSFSTISLPTLLQYSCDVPYQEVF
ncbi:MAG TPA: hypothetical protein PLO51_04370, partial [Candidatus Micrarchaeota archaeon]|nr:hypothetical protein [Candidatus Micrarchaeota archaeon]